MSAFDRKVLPSQDGFDLRAEAWYDEEWSEPDGEYTDEQREAFARGDWGYCGVVVVASRANIDLGSDSIWATEYGLIPGCEKWVDPLADDEGSSLSYYGPDLIEQAIDAAKAKLAELTQQEQQA